MENSNNTLDYTRRLQLFLNELTENRFLVLRDIDTPSIKLSAVLDRATALSLATTLRSAIHATPSLADLHIQTSSIPSRSHGSTASSRTLLSISLPKDATDGLFFWLQDKEGSIAESLKNAQPQAMQRI